MPIPYLYVCETKYFSPEIVNFGNPGFGVSVCFVQLGSWRDSFLIQFYVPFKIISAI